MSEFVMGEMIDADPETVPDPGISNVSFTVSGRFLAPPEELPAVVIVTGKGGVGTTTVTAAIARSAFDLGLKVLVVDVEDTAAWARLLPEGDRTGSGEGKIEFAHLRAQELLEEYLEARRLGLIARRLRNSGVLEVVGTAAPGIDDLVVLGKIKQLERSGQWDLILLDAPATGHAITMLTSPAGIASAVTAGPLRTQADEALAFLGDARRCRVMLVTLPEATPVNEVVETAFALEDRVGVQLGPVVVNLVDEPDSELMNLDLTGQIRDQVELAEGDAVELWEAARFRVNRALLQREQLGRLAVQLPLAQIHLPHIPTADLGASGISVLAARLTQWLSQSLHARPADL